MNLNSKLWRNAFLLALLGGLSLSGVVPSLSQPAVQTAPRVISSFPAQREVVGPQSALQIVFDQPMNRASVEAAFAIGPAVNGGLSWKDDQTLLYTPAGPLQRGAEYHVVIGTSAKSAAEVPLDESFRLDFQVTPNLTVSQVIPAPNAENIEAGATITVVFDRPVVPLVTTGEQANLPKPLRLDPPVEGVGEWVGTAIYTFRPTKALAGGALYTATIDSTLTDVDGSPMQGDYRWQFRTVAPQILSVSPQGGSLPLETSVVVIFNQPMDMASVREAFALRNAKTGGNVAGTLTLENEGAQLVFKPASRLELDTPYRITIAGSARSASGQATLSNPQTVDFTTVPYPRIVRTYPAQGEKVNPGGGVSIEFNAPMDRDSFKGRVHIDPQPDKLSINAGGNNLYLSFTSLSGTTYTVTIDPGVADPYGNTINEPFKLTFSTGDLPAMMNFAQRGQVLLTSAYRPNTAILGATVNVSGIEARLATLSVSELMGLSRGYGYFDLQNYQPGNVIRSWTQPVQAQPNIRADVTLNLASENGGQLRPGIYYLELFAPEWRRFLQSPVREPFKNILIVATAQLVIKQTPSGITVWVTDLKSGQPVSNAPVTIYDATQGLVGRGTTDASGMLRIDAPNNIFNPNGGLWAIVEGENLFGLTSANWRDNTFEPYQFEAYNDFQPTSLTAYLYTDQSIYRPGRPVYFRGIVRSRDDVTYAVPSGEPVQVFINDQNGQEVYNKTLNLNAFGAFSDKFDLAQGMPLGGYSIRARFRDQDTYLSFQVAEYRPPEFLVTATPAETQVAAGDLIKVTVDGKFLFGGAVSGARVDWVAIANQDFFIFRGVGNFDFAPRSGYVYSREVGRGSGTLDDKGQFVLELPADLGGVNVRQTFTIEATVTDLSNQSISGRTSVVVHPALVYVGVQPRRYVARAGEPLDVDVIVSDWDSKPQPGQNINIKVVERRWQQDPNTFEWRQTDIPVTETRLTTDDKGRATFTFTPPNAGLFEIEASTRDARERIAASATNIWVQGRNAVVWNANDRRLTLIADKKGQYKPGETASILITSPFPEPVKAWITVERADIQKTELVDITGSYTYELPIEAIHAPNVYVAVTIVRGSGAGTDDGSIVPDARYGLINLPVEVQQQLKVKITPSTTEAEPGKEVRFDVTITDLNDNPVVAEIGLSLTDLATLSVGGPNSGKIFDAFWSQRGLSVLTSGSLTFLIDALTFKDIYLRDESEARRSTLALQSTASPPGTLPSTGGGGLAGAPEEPSAMDGILAETKQAGAGADDKNAAPAPRSNFVDTPLWKADVVTDEAGKAQISVMLPDNLTTWRLDGRAISKETYVGDASLDIVSTKPLLVRPATPRFFVVGDEVELAMVVNNNTPDDLEVNVSLDAKGVQLRADGSQTVKIAKAGRVRVTWLATVQDVNAVDLSFAAVSGQYSDASKPAVGLGDDKLLPVYKYVAPDYVSTAGVVRQPGERVEGVVVPGNATSGELTLSLNPSLAAVTLDGLDYLRNFPYQCLEQTVSRFLPNIITYRALQKLGLDKPELRKQLEDAAAYALNRLKSEQKPDGGWGWYYNDESNLLTTTYAVFGLLEARDADLLVDQEMLARGLAFMQFQLGGIFIDDSTSAWLLNRVAFTDYVLARANSVNLNQVDQLMARREKMALYARAFLAQIYHRYRQAGNYEQPINTLISDLQSAAVVSATGTHWEEPYRDWWNWGSNTRSTAIILDTLTLLTPQSDLLPNVVRWLMVARRGDAWETTQETAWAVMALTRWMDVSGELKADYTYTVGVNGKEIGTGKANAETLRDTTTLKVEVADLLRDQVNRLTFAHSEGPGNLYYTATLHVEQPVEEIKPTNRGMAFTRTYFVDGKPVTEAKVGDVITVSLEITLNHDMYYVVINDPIPAGTEAIDRSLQTSAQIGQRPELSPTDPNPWRWGWGWWWFSFTELRTEKVVLSATYLPRGTYRYVYQIQATTPGTYRVIPPNGQEFYFPEVFGRGAGSLFVVKAE